MKNILSADIGGTNSRFGHFTVGKEGKLALVASKWLHTADARSFPDLIEMLKHSDFPLQPEHADIVIIAVAGPVEARVRSKPPLIEWDIDITQARQDLCFKKCILINDFIAQAFACPSPVGEAALKILPGIPDHDASAAVTGAGTGFGKALIVPDGSGGFIAVPSEGAHANFPFVSAEEYEYQNFLIKEREDRYITINTVVSGSGLSYLHQFLTGRKREPYEVTAEFDQYPKSVEWASRFYARVCRNYVLETLAMGGLYIAGGVAAKAPELITHPAFEAEFRTSDTMSELLAKIPVSLITDENSGLWGGAMLAKQTLR